MQRLPEAKEEIAMIRTVLRRYAGALDALIEECTSELHREPMCYNPDDELYTTLENRLLEMFEEYKVVCKAIHAMGGGADPTKYAKQEKEIRECRTQ